MTQIKQLVKCSEFVKRQTKYSKYSHFEGSWEELEKIVQDKLEFYQRNPNYINTYRSTNSAPPNVYSGYRKGVLLVKIMPVWLFRTATVRIDDKTKLKTNFAPRRRGESPYLRVSTKREKQVAKYVEVILYHKDVLEENKERSTNADWEIISINASIFKEEPMHYYTMARNYLKLPGGTAGNFSADDFAKSIIFWNEHVMSYQNPPLLNKLYERWSRSYLKNNFANCFMLVVPIIWAAVTILFNQNILMFKTFIGIMLVIWCGQIISIIKNKNIYYENK